MAAPQYRIGCSSEPSASPVGKGGRGKEREGKREGRVSVREGREGREEREGGRGKEKGRKRERGEMVKVSILI